MSERASELDRDDATPELALGSMQTQQDIDSSVYRIEQAAENKDDGAQTVLHDHPVAEQTQEIQQGTMVRTIGQIRSLIMDYPSSLIASNFFKALSDGTRLRLLQALSIREMCVSDLCTLLELSQPAISNHLRVLNHQRIVKMRRSGKNIFYSLDDWHINAIIGMAMEHLSFSCPE